MKSVNWIQLIVLCICGVAVLFALKSFHNKYKSCTERGGVLVRTSSGYICIEKPKEIK